MLFITHFMYNNVSLLRRGFLGFSIAGGNGAWGKPLKFGITLYRITLAIPCNWKAQAKPLRRRESNAAVISIQLRDFLDTKTAQHARNHVSLRRKPLCMYSWQATSFQGAELWIWRATWMLLKLFKCSHDDFFSLEEMRWCIHLAGFVESQVGP